MIEALAAGALAAAFGSPLGSMSAGGGRWRGGAQVDVVRVRTPYARVVLPTAIDPTPMYDYHDLRVYDDRGVEIPYVLDLREPEPQRRRLAPLERTFTHGAGTLAIFDRGAGAPRCEALALRVERDAYFTRVAIDAADDARHWRTIRDDALVYRVARDEAESPVTFMPTSARYLRVRVLDGRAPFPLAGVVPRSAGTGGPAVVQAAVTSSGERPDRRTQWFILDARAAHARIAAVRIESGTPSFARTVEVERSDNGSEWTSVATDRIERFAEGVPRLDVETGDAAGRYWRITIDDNDDAPLEAVVVRLFARTNDIVFPVAAGRTYALLYGDPGLQRPAYDLAARLAHERWRAQRAELGPLVRREPVAPPPGAVAPAEPVLPRLVTPLFTGAVSVLAGFALRLLRKGNPGGGGGEGGP
ncbi:MAG: hypothetical protein JWO85_3134 [Candidatus Eremiobacteraeota bacterium]|nr:hypothetical protein [Candidatus Eremiobacteraeota bacterium]